MTKPRFCSDCKHIYVSIQQGVTNHSRVSFCMHPSVKEPELYDLVSGKLLSNPGPFCADKRKPNSFCGPDGNLWEPKP